MIGKPRSRRLRPLAPSVDGLLPAIVVVRMASCATRRAPPVLVPAAAVRLLALAVRVVAPHRRCCAALGHHCTLWPPRRPRFSSAAAAAMQRNRNRRNRRAAAHAVIGMLLLLPRRPARVVRAAARPQERGVARFLGISLRVDSRWHAEQRNLHCIGREIVSNQMPVGIREQLGQIRLVRRIAPEPAVLGGRKLEHKPLNQRRNVAFLTHFAHGELREIPGARVHAHLADRDARVERHKLLVLARQIRQIGNQLRRSRAQTAVLVLHIAQNHRKTLAPKPVAEHILPVLGACHGRQIHICRVPLSDVLRRTCLDPCIHVRVRVSADLFLVKRRREIVRRVLSGRRGQLPSRLVVACKSIVRRGLERCRRIRNQRRIRVVPRRRLGQECHSVRIRIRPAHFKK
eukprot:comp21783_c0_seq1/m.48849 comp21783_c0_seq1/g.48849  ORF comp21783_c0_seq1/g.48849 comp21783_c0_seq1/m.48849 type:complete len:402 (-) comp21783_c0_seq1:9-1214(-)